MRRRLSTQEARAFADRWRLVNEAELAELRAQSFEEKFAQLEALMASARTFGWNTTDPAEVATVRARWNRLAAIHGR